MMRKTKAKIMWLVGQNCTGKTQIARAMLGCSLRSNSIYYDIKPRQSVGRMVELVLHGIRVRVYVLAKSHFSKIDKLIKIESNSKLIDSCMKVFKKITCRVWIGPGSRENLKLVLRSISMWKVKVLFIESGWQYFVFEPSLVDEIEFSNRTKIFIERASSDVEPKLIPMT